MAELHSGVRTKHPEYTAFYDKWQRVRNVLAADCDQYLRNVGASESDKVYAAQRQKEYADGAVMYNFTKRTLSGMLGAVTRKDAEVQLTPKTEYLLDNCDGSIGLLQHSKNTLKEVDSISRAGLLTDAPVASASSRADQNQGKLNPRILMYTAENIINWRHSTSGSVQVLSMVVLRESYQYQGEEDEFEWKTGYQYRVLEIVDGKYQQRLFKYDDGDSIVGNVEVFEPKIGGNSLSFIPFTFIGSDNNDSTVDSPALETLADINIGHYRNSADVEESGFICGQPTLMLYPGERMTPSQFTEMNPNGIRLGSRRGHNLGAGGSSELLQAQESNLSLTLMDKKEEQAVKAGAQLITPTIQITAESARLQRGADTSIMATIAINVSEAYEQAIKWCAEMLNDSGEIVFQLNTEFFMQQMTAQDRAAWVMDLNAGIMPTRSYYAAMRSAGTTDWTDEEIEEALLKEPPKPAPELNTSVSGDLPQPQE